MNDLEAAVLVTPPDPQWPTGILSVQVHEIRGLGIKMEGRERNAFKSLKSREGEKGQDQEDGEEEEGEGESGSEEECAVLTVETWGSSANAARAPSKSS